MKLNAFDWIAFALFTLAVVACSLYAARREKGAEDYFLAGRGLRWWLIGFSLLATNISTEHFVGMAGESFRIGLAMASWEWLASVTMVFVAAFFLPRYLRVGVYTTAEFLEQRYHPALRVLLACWSVLSMVGLTMAVVLYSGALALETIFGIGLVKGIWMIGILAGLYTVYGGLKAVVWSDLLQAVALLLGGALMTWLGLREIGGVEAFLAGSADKLHVVLPADHPKMPWTVLLFGMWIPNIGYWGTGQFIVQRTLAAKSLAEGQKGLLFGAVLKLLIPFVILMPGIMAFQLYGGEMADGDRAFPFMVAKLLPTGLRGLMLAALMGAVMSSLDSLLNSASTLFVMDVYKRCLHRDASSKTLLRLGQAMTFVFLMAGCLCAPLYANSGGVFLLMAKIGAATASGSVAAFLFALFVPRVPRWTGLCALLLSPVLYVALLMLRPGIAFVNSMGIVTLTLLALMAFATWRWPSSATIPAPPPPAGVDLSPWRHLKSAGAAICLATAILYAVFW
jgi:SSS family solute:Na+ symporter